MTLPEVHHSISQLWNVGVGVVQRIRQPGIAIKQPPRPTGACHTATARQSPLLSADTRASNSTTRGRCRCTLLPLLQKLVALAPLVVGIVVLLVVMLPGGAAVCCYSCCRSCCGCCCCTIRLSHR